MIWTCCLSDLNVQGLERFIICEKMSDGDLTKGAGIHITLSFLIARMFAFLKRPKHSDIKYVWVLSDLMFQVETFNMIRNFLIRKLKFFLFFNKSFNLKICKN